MWEKLRSDLNREITARFEMLLYAEGVPSEPDIMSSILTMKAFKEVLNLMSSIEKEEGNK